MEQAEQPQSRLLLAWRSLIAGARAIAKSFIDPEGSWRGPYFGIGELGGIFRLSGLEDGFQRNLNVSPSDAKRFAPIYGAVSSIAQALSRIQIQHHRREADQRLQIVTNKAPYRVFRKPNDYQSRSDFILNGVYSLLYDGNMYAVALRNERFEVDSLHLVNPRNMWPYVVENAIFYRFGDQSVSELAALQSDTWFPARDVLHVRMFCPRHPLVGETPIKAALYPAFTGATINKHMAAFFANLSRPSGIIRHPGKLSPEAMRRMKDKFVEITQGAHFGEPLVLQENADWKPLTMSAVDAELIKSYDLTERQIMQVFHIPPFLYGYSDKTNLANVESLLRFFVQSCLGFYIQHLEDAFTLFFNLPPGEEIHFDVETALLRGDFETRMNALSKATQNGTMSPNEARAREGLPPVQFGNEPRVQQQLVPLSYGMNLQPPGMMPPAPNDDPAQDDESKQAASEAAAIIVQLAIEKAIAAAGANS